MPYPMVRAVREDTVIHNTGLRPFAPARGRSQMKNYDAVMSPIDGYTGTMGQSFGGVRRPQTPSTQAAPVLTYTTTTVVSTTAHARPAFPVYSIKPPVTPPPSRGFAPSSPESPRSASKPNLEASLPPSARLTTNQRAFGHTQPMLVPMTTLRPPSPTLRATGLHGRELPPPPSNRANQFAPTWSTSRPSAFGRVRTPPTSASSSSTAMAMSALLARTSLGPSPSSPFSP